jgi:hypothetical protein
MAKATHVPVKILLILDQSEEVDETEYAVFSGLISRAEGDLLDIFNSAELWSPRNAEVNAYCALINWFANKIEVDRWRPGNPIDETHLEKVVPEEMKKMLKAMQRKYLNETYQYVIIDNGIDGYSVEESMMNYIEYLQCTIQRSPGLLKRSWETTIEQLPVLLNLAKPERRDASPIREIIIKSSSQDPD